MRVIRSIAALVLACTVASPSLAEVVARQVIAMPTGPVTVLLNIDKEQRAKLVMRDAQERRVDEKFLDTTADVLPLLANRRLSAFWPALMEWGGPGLEALRARMLAQSEAAYAQGKTAFKSTPKGYTRSGTTATLERAVALAHGGQADAGIALLRTHFDSLPAKGETDKIELANVAGQLAKMLFDDGKLEQGLAVLDTTVARIGDSSSVMYPLINRAISLVFADRYEEALAAFEPAEAQYQHRSLGALLRTVPGTKRHFAWVEACALNGLGKTEQARTALAPALGKSEPAKAAEIATNSETRLIAYACLKDREAFVTEALANLAEDRIAPAAAVLLQPSTGRDEKLRTRAAFLASVREDPRIKAASRSSYRELPAELEPALRAWRE